MKYVYNINLTAHILWASQGRSGQESACQCSRRRRRRFIPGSGRSSGGGNGNPLQYSYQDNPMHRGAWRAMVQGVTKSRTQLSPHVYCKHKELMSLMITLLCICWGQTCILNLTECPQNCWTEMDILGLRAKYSLHRPQKILKAVKALKVTTIAQATEIYRIFLMGGGHVP